MLLDIWDASAWVTAAQFFGLIVGAYVAILWIALALWTWRDVRSRTTDTATQAVCVGLVALFFLPGLVLYMIARPQETLEESQSRRIEEQAFVRELQRQPSCPACRRAVEADFNNCPHCVAVLRVACDSCGERMATNWVACAFCGEARQAAPVSVPDFRRRTLGPVAGVGVGAVPASRNGGGLEELRRRPVVAP